MWLLLVPFVLGLAGAGIGYYYRKKWLASAQRVAGLTGQNKLEVADTDRARAVVIAAHEEERNEDKQTEAGALAGSPSDRATRAAALLRGLHPRDPGIGHT